MKHQSLLLVFIFAIFVHTAYAAGDDDLIVVIKDFKFMPQEITIKKGQILRWENREKRQYHSVWFEMLDEEEPADYLFPDDVYEREFTQTGIFRYRCGPHPEMTGIVLVTD